VCFCFALPRLVNPMLPISLDCQFLIALRARKDEPIIVSMRKS
jgi:hypothetical protein